MYRIYIFVSWSSISSMLVVPNCTKAGLVYETLFRVIRVLSDELLPPVVFAAGAKVLVVAELLLLTLLFSLRSFFNTLGPATTPPGGADTEGLTLVFWFPLIIRLTNGGGVGGGKT